MIATGGRGGGAALPQGNGWGGGPNDGPLWEVERNAAGIFQSVFHYFPTEDQI